MCLFRLACTLSYTSHGGVLHYVNKEMCDVPIALSFTHNFMFTRVGEQDTGTGVKYRRWHPAAE